ncbi:hypothetical protein HDU79_005923 [Rhizoclosmatium sp. JEL0117]|nr:hypothetical protein HDU79_005923 [Rhizoclosmatium sp. JEL0117]
MTRSFIPLLLTLILALVAFADQSNYGDVHKEAQAYKKDVVQEMQNLGDATAAQQSHIKEVEDSVLFFTLHDHNKDGHLDGHELLALYAGQDIKVGSDGRPVPGSVPPGKLADLIKLVDTVLDMDDTDNDGMISWEEYLASQEYHKQT